MVFSLLEVILVSRANYIVPILPARPNPTIYAVPAMLIRPGTLARGPWQPSQVTARWRETPFEPTADAARAADDAITALHDRGSPSHDGLSARLIAFQLTPPGITLELQPIRWGLRLSPTDASQSVAAMCVVRAADGRWLAGRRAAWLASWPGRWTLGAGGSVEPGENPADTLTRELREEWSLQPERMTVEALICLPQRLILLVGLAWLAEGASVERDSEHDNHAWWHADPEQWPPDADGPVRQLGAMLAQ
jgi:8-oxo-dGTP diphosphatase